MIHQPIIFIGMHRSGTSLLGQLLESLGLFSGTQKDENNEAVFFRQLNDWLLSQCGGRWDMPKAIDYLWGHEDVLKWTEDYVRYLLDSPRAIQFLGFSRFLQTGGIITRLPFPWGWKDPRNTFTLPFWLRIFPGAKIVYIERHGVDVAQSLMARNTEIQKYTTQKYQKFKKLTPFYPKRYGFVDSPRCTSLLGGFTLWEEYLDQAAKVLAQFDKSRVLTLRYEELLNNPGLKLSECAKFCGIACTDEKIDALIKNIDSSRAYSYLNFSVLSDFANDQQIALNKRGYK